jgi:septal ring factor EnvC (AmiA/AmiB activator)
LRHALWLTPRWGRAEWQNAPVETVVAEAGHAVRGEEYSQFLVPPPLKPSDHSTLEQALRHAEDLLRQEREEAVVLQQSLQNAEQRARQAEDLLRQAREELRAAQIVMDDDRANAIKLQNRVRAQEAIAAVQTAFASQSRCHAEAAQTAAELARDKLRAIEGSSTWRISGTMRAFFARRPKARRFLRGGLAMANRLRRVLAPG